MYYFEQFSDDYYRVINQSGVFQARPWMPGNENFNCCWDGACAPDGTFYTTLSSETGRCDHAKLVRYDRESNELVQCFYAGDLVLPKDRQLPHSKLHTSIDFIPTGDRPEDYLVIATTHSTDRAKHHEEWMPFGHQNHVWEGFPGSQILVYDPKTDRAESWGTPVPHESIYGAKYDPKHRRLYMIGFMRGHVYSFDIDSRQVTRDLGKAAEVFCFRLALGADGNIYGCTKSGYPFMVDTEANQLVDLGYTVPEYPGRYVHNTWYRYLGQAENSLDGKFLYMLFPFAYDLYTLEFATKAIKPVGYLLPYKDGQQVKDLVRPINERSSTGNNCMTMDKYGVLWYVLAVRHRDTDEDVKYKAGQYLCRWDITGGGKPELLGLVGTPEYVQNRSTEMGYDQIRDILYIVNVGHGFGAEGPDVVRINLPEFRKKMYEPGPLTSHQVLYPEKMSPEELAERARKRASKTQSGEEVTANNPFQAFPIDKAYPVRLWREIGEPGQTCARIEDAKVIGMAYAADGLLHVVSGAAGVFAKAAFVFKIRGREVVSREDFSQISADDRAWLEKNILPGPVTLAESIKLPEATGRRYRAKPSAQIAWNGGRSIVGTLDALLAIISAQGKVYSLGHAVTYGPVRCLCTNADQTKLWGVAGDEEDMGYVFSYDDEAGLVQLGMLSYNSAGYYRPTESNILSSIVLAPDEKTLAIGSADRIATVHLIDLTP